MFEWYWDIWLQVWPVDLIYDIICIALPSHIFISRDPDPCVQKQEILCSCSGEMGWTRRSCCPSRTFVSPSRDQVSSGGPPSFHGVHAASVTRTPYLAAHLKVGCENTVVRMVSSGKFVSRVSFSYRLLDSQELQTIKLNNVEDFCFNVWFISTPSFDWIFFF